MSHYSGYEMYLRHWLFKVARSVALSRSNGSCECGAAATEIHHKAYPAWGAFDTPTNLVAVCHTCHCKKHQKEH